MIGSRQRGFTLIEILLATALLASGLALAFTTLRAATATATRGESLAQRSERMRAVAGFLRARLVAARPVPFDLDEDSGLARRFRGAPDAMAFVADLPDYLGRGGPYLHRFSVEGTRDEQRIEVEFLPVQGGAVVETPEPLAPEALPLQVEIRVEDVHGRAWPPLVVALPLAGSYAVPAGAP